jgi:serine/threonine protein phosphatase 1
MKRKRFVVGDIHGAHKALLQCLERSGFNYEEDLLISVGDVADGWTEVPETFDELLKVKDLVYVIGNHDLWLLDWFETGRAPHIWLSQGGKNTWDAYKRLIEEGDTTRSIQHENLLKNAKNYYVLNNKLFVHGGYNWHFPIERTPDYNLVWDRDMWNAARYWQRQADKGMKLDQVKEYDEIFIGHTTTSRVDPELKPVHASNVWNVDQGAGWEGKLTIMDIDTKEYWQSDIVKDLYPDVQGR